MIKRESECYECQGRCLGSACPARHGYRFICDECGEEVDVLFHYDDEQLCAECILGSLDKVTIDDYDDEEDRYDDSLY